MMEIWNFLTVHIPWEAYLIAFGLLFVGGMILTKAYGITVPPPILATAAAAAGLLVILARATQKGYALRKVDENTADQQAKDDFTKIHQKDESLNDQQLDQKNDPWLRD